MGDARDNRKRTHPSPNEFLTVDSKKTNKNLNKINKFEFKAPTIITRNTYKVLSDSDMEDYESANNTAHSDMDTKHKQKTARKPAKNRTKTSSSTSSPLNENTQQSQSSEPSGNKIDYYITTDKGPFIIIMEKEDINDIKVGKRLKELNIMNIKDITKIGKNRLKVQTKDGMTANKILKDPTLSITDRIKSFLPNSSLITVGIIRDIDIDITEEEIENNYSCESKIISIERMTRWDDKLKIAIPNNNIKITFRSHKLPNNFKLYSVSRKIEIFVPKPILCKKCLVYGHTKKYCKRETVERCLNCTENLHDSAQSCVTKCKFCNVNDHKTAFYKCPEEIKQKKIKRIMVTQKISYQDAHKINNEGNNANFPPLPNNKITIQNSFANVLMDSKIKEDLKRKTILLNVVKEKFNHLINSKSIDTDVLAIEIGNLLAKHSENITEKTEITTPSSETKNESTKNTPN